MVQKVYKIQARRQGRRIHIRDEKQVPEPKCIEEPFFTGDFVYKIQKYIKERQLALHRC